MNIVKSTLLILALGSAAHASTLGIGTSEESYAYWETFTPLTTYPATVINIAGLAPTASDTSDFSATFSASMSGSTPGSGDRIYSGVMASSNPFNLSLDGVAHASLSTLTLQLKFTGPTVNGGTFEQNIDGATAHFDIAADVFWGEASQFLVDYESGGGYFIFAWTWTDLNLVADDTFSIEITSAAGHVSLDAVRLDSGTVSAVPEPSSFAAFAGLGAISFAALRRRRRA